VTPHNLRHTFASILSALGREPVFPMRQLGHSDPRFTLRVYTHVMSRGDDERERLRALVEGDLTSLHETSPPRFRPPRGKAVRPVCR
jgi:site-specific recombinase XerD